MKHIVNHSVINQLGFCGDCSHSPNNGICSFCQPQRLWLTTYNTKSVLLSSIVRLVEPQNGNLYPIGQYLWKPLFGFNWSKLKSVTLDASSWKFSWCLCERSNCPTVFHDQSKMLIKTWHRSADQNKWLAEPLARHKPVLGPVSHINMIMFCWPKKAHTQVSFFYLNWRWLLCYTHN